MRYKKPLCIYSIDEPYPVPSQAEIDQEPQWMLLFNDWEWKVAQSLMGSLANPDIWERYPEELDQALLGLNVPDDPIVAEWITGWDFRNVTGGFSVVAGGGGQWVSSNGWQSTDLGSARQVHIEKTFPATGITGFLLLFRLGTVAANQNQLEVKLLQGGTDVTMYSANPTNTSIQDVTVEGATYTNVTRLRLRLWSTATTPANVALRQILLWGNGSEPS